MLRLVEDCGYLPLGGESAVFLLICRISVQGGEQRLFCSAAFFAGNSFISILTPLRDGKSASNLYTLCVK
ncbi:hypothetical protein D3C76_1493430 [compost metagenome]